MSKTTIYKADCISIPLASWRAYMIIIQVQSHRDIQKFDHNLVAQLHPFQGYDCFKPLGY